MSQNNNKISFTEMQWQAIVHEGSDLIVSASAGAGKTAVLIDYIFRKVALPDNGRKVSIQEILAMTFTEAAAQSMKKRLFERMNRDLSEEEKNEGYDEEHLRQQAKLLPSADICTIDSFCAKILNQYCYILGWDPERPKTLIDGNTVARLKADAAHETLMKYMSEGNKDLLDLVSSYSSNGNHTGAFENILVSLGNDIDSFDDEESWFKKVEAYYENDEFDKMDEENRKQFYFSVIKKVAGIIGSLERYLEVSAEAIGIENAREQIKRTLTNAKDVMKMLEQEDSRAFMQTEYIELITPAKLFPKPSASKKIENYSDQDRFNAEHSEDNRNIYKPFYDEAKKMNDSLNGYTLLHESFALQNRHLKPKIKLLLEMVREYRVLADQKKADLNGIDFVDMEKAAIRILENKEIAERFRNKYRYILVDEYQDSNDIQEKLVQLIARKDPGNVFRVGDIKQSIYGFRGAKPELMRSVVDKAKTGEKIVFKDNFRSSDIIVRFNNELYKTMMNINNYNDTYTEENDVAKAGSSKQKQAKEKVEVHLLDLKDEEKDAPKKLKDARIDESIYVARKIAEMRENSLRKKEELKAEWEGLDHEKQQQFFHDNGIYTEWKDYVVLVRSHNFKRIMEKAFDDEGVPKFFITNTGYYSDVAVQTTISWLKWIFDRKNEIAMFSVLSSPYYNWNNETIADFAIEFRKRKNEYNDRCSFLFDEYEDIAKDYEQLKDINDKEGTLSLISAIMNLHDYYYEKTTIEQRDNLALFYEKCISVNELYPDLESILEWLKINEEADEGSATSISESEDVVRIITIHNSKGLEYPVVFYLADSLKRGIAQSVQVRTDEKLGLALNVCNMPYRISFSPLVWKNIDDRHYQDDIEEEIRLMYVATTRAMSKLVITALEDPEQSIKFDASTIERNAAKQTAVGDMIRQIIENNENMKELCDIYHLTNKDIKAGNRQMVQKTSQGFVMKKYVAKNVGYTESSPSSLEERKAYKISYKEKEDGALRGTLIHKAFEQVDFKDPKIEDIKVPISDEDKNKVMNFFEHELYEKIKNMEIHHELPYALIEEGTYMHGFMDLVCMNDEEIILVDFKSDLDKNKEEYIEAYAGQQNAYRQALKKFALPIKCYLYSLELNEFIEVPE